MSGFENKSTDVRPQSPAVTEAWSLTLEDMESIAEERRADGWEVVAMPAVHTSPVSRDMGDDPGRFGLVHVIPDNHADAFAEAYEAGTFAEYLAYRRKVDGSIFLVTELIDPDSNTIILLASHYYLLQAEAMIESTRDAGVIYTHAKTLDGTELGRFRHDEYEPFLPEVDEDGPPADGMGGPAADGVGGSPADGVVDGEPDSEDEVESGAADEVDSQAAGQARDVEPAVGGEADAGGEGGEGGDDGSDGSNDE